MTEFEVTCKVEKGERDIAYGEDCFCYYTQPNYNERIVRCKDCKHLVGVGIDFYYCGLFRARGPYDYELHKPAYDGFCAWGEPKVVG